MRRLLAILALFLLPAGPAWALDPWAGCDFLTAGAGLTITCPDLVTGGATITASGGAGTGSVTSFSAGNLSPLFTTSVATATTTPALTFSLSTAADDTIYSNISGGTAAPQFNTSNDVFDNQLTSTRGTVAFRGVGHWDGLPPGTNGMYLQTQGAGSDPVWSFVTSASLNITPTTCTNQFLTGILSNGVGACSTAVLSSAQFANQGTTTTVLHGNAAGNPSFSAIIGADIDVTLKRRVCTIIIGADNGTILADADLGPQGRQCFIPAAATVVEVNVAANDGTPNIIPRRNRAGAGANFVSGALATAASGGIACSNTGGTTGIDGATTCTNTLQNTGLNAGDYIELISGTAGGTAKRMSIFVIYTIN